jgi:hypothetical protein
MEALKQAANNKLEEAKQATMEGVETVQNKAKETGQQVNEGMNNIKQTAESTVQGAKDGVGNAYNAQVAQHEQDSQHKDGKLGAGYDRAKEEVNRFVYETIPGATKEAGKQLEIAKVSARGAFDESEAEYSKTEPNVELAKGGRRRRRKRRKSKRWPRKKSKSKSKKSRKRRKKKGGRKSRKKKRRRSRKKSRRRRRR